MVMERQEILISRWVYSDGRERRQRDGIISDSSECYEDDYSFINLCIYEEDRNIQISINDSAYGFNKDYANSVEKAKGILYDLIKADLVEKID